MIRITRDKTPAYMFEVILTRHAENLDGVATFTCGFSVFVPRNSEPAVVVEQVRRTLKGITPLTLSVADTERFQ